MNGHALHTIGELARRTGVPVRTIRFYSDRGLLPPADRSPSGHRRYDDGAAARLELVRTLRELGLDLAAVRKVVERRLALPEVAATHAETLEAQIRVLRARHAVLTAVARRGATPEETRLMHRLALLSASERRRLADDFLDAAFGGVAGGHAFAGVMRSMTPELPDDPDTEQLRAWVELAELAQDSAFRACMRQLAADLAADHVRGELPTLHRSVAAVVRDEIAPAVATGLAPDSPRAAPLVAALLTRCAPLLGSGDPAESSDRLLTRLLRVNDPRRERYLALLATVNGWPAPQTLRPVLDWAVQALRARTAVEGARALHGGAH